MRVSVRTQSRLGWYRRKDGSPMTVSEIHGRCMHSERCTGMGCRVQTEFPASTLHEARRMVNNR